MPTATASLIISGSTLKITGNGPIAAKFTKDMVKRVFVMPANSVGFWSTDTRLSVHGILSRLTKASYQDFISVIKRDAELSTEYDTLCKNFAAYAYPTTGTWPPCDGLMVLESIPVDLPFLMSITWMLDGSIHLGLIHNQQELRVTPAEFLAGYGKTWREYCETQLPLALDRCQRALSLISVDEPKTATVSFINRKSEVEKKTMVYWQSDQIEQYLRRHELSHIATDPE